MLHVRDLVTAYGNIEALHGISLDAAEGQITCLLGPNGAGKTTTLFTIAGILSARSGSVELGGEDLTQLSAAKVVSRGIALVPENRLVFPRMDVEEKPSGRSIFQKSIREGDRSGHRGHVPALPEPRTAQESARRNSVGW